MKEIWKNIPHYNGSYMVSNLGRIKSLKFGKEKILKPAINGRGYYVIGLSIHGRRKTTPLHRIVFEAFHGRTNLQVHHNIEGNKINCALSNLSNGSQRKNTSDYFSSIKKSSKYTGVTWDRHANKWKAAIYINGRVRHLGLFIDEYEASNAYKNALKNI